MAQPWKHLMMCHPRYYNVKHFLLNAHMTMEKQVSYATAMKQWDYLYDTLIKNGVKIEKVEEVPDLVDMVFTANAAIIYKNSAVVANFGAEPRIPESEHYIKFSKRETST
eukprot:UN22621